MSRRLIALAVALALAALGGQAIAGRAHAAAPGPDCDGPAPDAQPDTPAYTQREQDNDSCGEQRFQDTSSNPAFQAAEAALAARSGGAPPEEDPFRDPDQLNGVRFRTQTIAFTDALGQRLPGRLFRPCDAGCRGRPPGVQAPPPPYPGVIVVHGGSANQEMYLWGSEALAEAGYMVLTFQIPEPDNAESDFHYPDTKDALNYFLSTPQHPTKEGDVNPLWRELARDHIGLAGHSAGGVAVSQIGQEDPRVSAIVSWDRAQSSPMPAGLRLRTPALFVVADFNCQKVPVCVPQPYTSPPDPKGPGNKDEDFQRVAGAGVDTMKIALRAATHLDFTQFAPGTGSRYGAVTTSYYTLAWFDRYLRGAMPGQRALVADAFRRLTATRFDASADVHNISGGTFDTATGQDVPAHIAGQPVRDRLSFHFRSAWSFDRGRIVCQDIRAGCAAPAAAPALPQLPAPTAGHRAPRTGLARGNPRGPYRGEAPCPPAHGFRTASVRPHRGALKFIYARAPGAGRVSVDVYQTAVGRTLRANRRVAHFTGHNRAFSWHARQTPDGYYFARLAVRDRHGRLDVRRYALRRLHGRWTRRPGFYRAAGCSAIPFFKLESPTFGGSRHRPIVASYRIARRGTVTLVVLRGRRTVRRVALGRPRAGVVHRVVIRRTGTARGDLRVRLELRADRRTVSTSLCTRRL